jgi:hypothetical protein
MICFSSCDKKEEGGKCVNVNSIGHSSILQTLNHSGMWSKLGVTISL